MITKKVSINFILCYSLIFVVMTIVLVERCDAFGTSNYVMTRAAIAPTYGAYPAKGELRTDPVTGAGITRIADNSELTGDYDGSSPDQSIIVYSRYTPTNTTNEFVLIHGDNSTSCWVSKLSDNSIAPFNSSTKVPIRFKPSLGSSSRSLGEINELRWDYSGAHPYRLYFVGLNISNSQAVGSENVGMSFYYTDIDPATGVNATPVLIRDFSAEFPATGSYPTGGYAGAALMNDVEGDSSNDSRYWAWQVMNIERGAGYLPYAFIVYDKQTDTILGRMQRNCTGVSGACTVLNSPATSSPYLSKPNMVEISPSGLRIVLDWGRTYTGNRTADAGTLADGPKACLKNMTDCIRIGADETHSGWAWGPNGEEIFVSQNNRNDYIEAVDIATAATANCVPISGNDYRCGIQVISYEDLDVGNWTLGMHFGKVYDQSKRGWLFMNTYDDNYSTWGKNQNLFIEIKPYDATPAPRLWRANPSYNVNYDYRSEGSGALSFDATAIFATANWGYTDGRAEAYVIGLPGNWYQHFNGSGDTTAPTVTAFIIPSTATSQMVTISNFTASDNAEVTGYMITENASVPSASSSAWSAFAPTSFTFSGTGAKTAYSWAKDAAGNVSSPISRSIIITIPDITSPVINTFTMPATSTSTIVAVTAFTATDNVGVTGYLIVEGSVPPSVSASGWTASAPTTFTFSSAGSKMAYAWAKDAAGNLSNGMGRSVTITLPDAAAPVVSAFTMPAAATSLTVSISSFTATDNAGVIGYLITESATAPAAGAAGWTASAPTSFTFSTAGSKTAYAWAKDAAGNVSASHPDAVSITLLDTTAPVVSAFTIPATASSTTVAISSFTATDNAAVTGYLITESTTVPTASAAGWTASAPTSFTFSAAGNKTASAWAKDAAGNVSSSRSAAVAITLPDTTAPVVSTFTMPATATSLTVDVSSLTATDAVGVNNYLITESATAPAAGAAGWTASDPTSYTFSTAGSKTAFAWAKDAAGNVSNSLGRTVTITLPVTAVPTGTAYTISDALLALRIAVGLVNPTPEQRVRSDVAPVDDNIDVSDALGILRDVVGTQKLVS